LSASAEPGSIAQAARETGCLSVAYTYNDPVIWAEYAIATAKACRAAGIKNVAVTAGYISADARAEFFEFMDAANVDLKAFTEDFYRKITYSHLAPVLETLVYLKRETDVWFELTNLMIPGENDNPDDLRRMCNWIVESIGDEVPIHFTAFHPDFRMLDHPSTPLETLILAQDIAISAGIKFAYVGNVHDKERQSTRCPGCGELLVERDWYQLSAYNIDVVGRCNSCQTRIPGRFGEAKGDWGAKRQPIRIDAYSQASRPSSQNGSQMPIHEPEVLSVTSANREAPEAQVMNTTTESAAVAAQPQMLNLNAIHGEQGQAIVNSARHVGSASRLWRSAQTASRTTGGHGELDHYGGVCYAQARRSLTRLLRCFG
jgi:AmmeMemoRadiSam system radical SAM enzyme